MPGMGEHIDDSRSFELISVFGHQCIQVSGQCSLVTGDVDDPLRIDALDMSDNFRRATSRRIKQQAAPVITEPAFRAIDAAQVGTAKFAVGNAVLARIVCRSQNLLIFAFHAEYVMR